MEQLTEIEKENNLHVVNKATAMLHEHNCLAVVVIGLRYEESVQIVHVCAEAIPDGYILKLAENWVENLRQRPKGRQHHTF